MTMEDKEKKRRYLMLYQQEKQAAVRLEQQLTELRPKQIHFSTAEDPTGDSMDRWEIPDYREKVKEIEQDIKAAIYQKVCVFQQIQKHIEAMENEQEKDLLTYRYLLNLKWEEVGNKMGYSWQHVHKIHARALENFKMR